jgi:hypothetical protein
MTGGKSFYLSSFNFINFKATFRASNSDMNTEVYDGNFSWRLAFNWGMAKTKPVYLSVSFDSSVNMDCLLEKFSM